MVKHDVEVESSEESTDKIDKLTEVSMKLINIGSMQVFDQFNIRMNQSSSTHVTTPHFSEFNLLQRSIALYTDVDSREHKFQLEGLGEDDIIALIYNHLDGFQHLTVIENYLGPKIGDDLQKVLQRYTADLIQKYYVKPALEPIKIQTSTTDLEPESEKSASKIHNIKNEQAEKQKMSKYTIKSIDKAALKEYDQKSALYQTMNENKSFNKNPAN
ncbi:hypothetical protein Tco_0364912 [Tanacetum coccineum]